jgi:DNA-directed RNA polymerase subunit L
VQEFADWIVSQDNSFEMAYAIDQDKVANMTIRLQFNSDSKWTKALKYMLTNLKYCLKWAITHQNLERNASAARTSHNQTNPSCMRQ